MNTQPTTLSTRQTLAVVEASLLELAATANRLKAEASALDANFRKHMKTVADDLAKLQPLCLTAANFRALTDSA